MKPWIADYLNRPDVQRRLGIDEMRGQNTTMTPCSDKIRRNFTVAGDQLHSSNPFTEEVLHRGVNVLHLIGANDWICSHVCISVAAMAKNRLTSCSLNRWQTWRKPIN